MEVDFILLSGGSDPYCIQPVSLSPDYSLSSIFFYSHCGLQDIWAFVHMQ